MFSPGHLSRSCFLQATYQGHVFSRPLIKGMFASGHLSRPCLLQATYQGHVCFRPLIKVMFASGHLSRPCLLQATYKGHVCFRPLIKVMFSLGHLARSCLLQATYHCPNFCIRSSVKIFVYILHERIGGLTVSIEFSSWFSHLIMVIFKNWPFL